MAETLKRLGAVRPADTNENTAYTVPGATSACISSIFVCNQDTSTRAFSIAVTSGGAAAVDDWLYYAVLIPANDTFAVTAGFTLATGYKIVVKASLADKLSFSVFGTEVV